jgi:hypothetical protein
LQAHYKFGQLSEQSDVIGGIGGIPLNSIVGSITTNPNGLMLEDQMN